MARVLFWVHGWPPVHNAGAEWAVHELAVHLQAAGHTVRVLQGMPHPGSWEGIDVGRRGPWGAMLREARESDAVITHLDHSSEAVAAAHQVGVPVVHYVHNHRQLAFHGIGPDDRDLVIFNSQWLAERLGPWPTPAMVCTPIISVDRYAIERDHPDRGGQGAHVTQVYLSKSKGAEVFYGLAEREPMRPFLGVEGSYGGQYRRPDLANVTYQANTARMRERVYARTRVVTMASDYESWGRVAVEAMCSGIPVIAHPTPGLREALGQAGIYEDRDHLDGWQRRLLDLDDPLYYAQRSELARERAVFLETQARTQADVFSTWLSKL